MTVYNHFLFSEIFFQHIRSETADLSNLRATLGTIRDTWQYYLPAADEWTGQAWKPIQPISVDDVGQLRSYLVEQIFAYLELTYAPHPADQRAFFLYADWAKEDCTGLCLVLPYSADIEGRVTSSSVSSSDLSSYKGIIPKGCNYAQQLLNLLREYELNWGVLTNGRHWRLFHSTELSPTDTYLHIDLERVVTTTAFIEAPLSTQVEEIVRQFCQGLVDSCRVSGQDVRAFETRTDIYKNALFWSIGYYSSSMLKLGICSRWKCLLTRHYVWAIY
jgi:hypothetical protein